MNNIKYDIFISYRRKDTKGEVSGTHIARNIQQRLLLKGYSVFFDFSEIKANKFEDTILPALVNSKALLLVLSKDALVRCVNDGDWVRREISTAIKHDIKIIPINPDKIFKNWPDTLPDELKPITKEQVSDIDTEQLFDVSVDKLIKDRIAPYIESKVIFDAEISNFNESLRKGDTLRERKKYKKAKERYKEAECIAKKQSILSRKELIELQYKIALCAFYAFKDDIEEDEADEADEYFSLTQEQFIDSFFYSGYIFEHCKTPNREKAFEKYGKAAQNGSGKAQNRIEEEICQLQSEADKLYGANEYQKAIELYQKALGLSDDDWYKNPIDNELDHIIAKKKELFIEYVNKKDFSSASLEFKEVLSLRIGNRFYNVGKTLYDNKEYTRAIDFLVKALGREIHKANYILGVIYSYGLGITADKKKGYDYYLDAAKSGHVLAQMEVAKYHQKNGYPDLAEAWWRMAAEKGNSDAQFELALFLYNPQIDSIYAATIDLDERKERQKEAASWYEKSANQGNPNAMYRLAWMYLWGVGVKNDIDNAFALYRKAISTDCVKKESITKNFITALTMIASKKMESKDYKEALELYLEAASLGDDKHYKLIAFIYQNGTNDVKDAEKAIEWYLKVIDKGDTSVFGTLGKLYVVHKQISKAEDNFRKAIAAGDNAAKLDLASLLNSEGDNLMDSSYINGCSDSFDNNLIKSIAK